MLTVVMLLALAAFVVTIGAAMNRAPLWPAVLLLTVIVMITSLALPLR